MIFYMAKHLPMMMDPDSFLMKKAFAEARNTTKANLNTLLQAWRY